jgi:hypothetical protein
VTRFLRLIETFLRAQNPQSVQIEPLWRKLGLIWIVALAVVFPAAAADADGLSLRIIEGQGSINNVRTHSARAPIVELRDDQNKPVAGASVTFQAPFTGPGATFGSERALLTQTDSEGRATGRGLVPNGVTGPFEIRVTAAFNSQVVSASIRQINASPAESRSNRKVLWIGLAAGAAAGGVLAATHGHSSPTGALSVPSTSTLSAGTSTFGPPQ